MTSAGCPSQNTIKAQKQLWWALPSLRFSQDPHQPLSGPLPLRHSMLQPSAHKCTHSCLLPFTCASDDLHPESSPSFSPTFRVQPESTHPAELFSLFLVSSLLVARARFCKDLFLCMLALPQELFDWNLGLFIFVIQVPNLGSH